MNSARFATQESVAHQLRLQTGPAELLFSWRYLVRARGEVETDIAYALAAGATLAPLYREAEARLNKLAESSQTALARHAAALGESDE